MIESYKALADHFSAQGVMGKDSTESKEVPIIYFSLSPLF